jgi:aspartate-semialdehyde dehydrogenase
MSRSPSVAIVGATGAVGVEVIRCLEARRFALSNLKLLASPRSAGKTLPYAGRELPIEALGEKSLAGVDIAIFSAGSGTSKTYAPPAAKAGTIVVDNSSAFRMDRDVPLVVPEINPDAMREHKGIIANPNCVTIIAAVPLWPLHKINPIRRIIATSYQSASGAGAAAMAELEAGTRAFLAGEAFTPKVLPHPYAFNLFSHNAKVDPTSLYNDEETKVMNEFRKIFGVSDLRVSATCIRVPVLRAHSIALNVEFERPMTPAQAREVLVTAPGVKVVDDAARNYFPMPIDASGQGDVLTGRIRQDVSDSSGRSLALFVSGDQLLKGAALNAVQIAEALVTRH